MKYSFIEAVELINDNEEFLKRKQIDLRCKSAERLKRIRVQKEQKFQKEVNFVIDNIPNAQDA